VRKAQARRSPQALCQRDSWVRFPDKVGETLRSKRTRMPAQPDLILWGAQIRTLDPDLPSCTAVAVKDGSILTTGDDDTILAKRGPGTAVIDARGIAFVPGLTDSHIHPLLGTIQTRGANLFDAKDLTDLRARIDRERQRSGNGWVLGWGLHYEPFEESGIHADVFDDVTQGRPMLLSFFDGHTDLANRAALSQAGVSGPIKFKEEATVVCVDGVPTGELQESAAMSLVRSVVPEPSADTLYGWYAESFRRFNEVGLTAIHAMDGSPEELGIYRRLEENGDLTCRAVVPMWQKPNMSLAEMRDQVPFRDERGRLWRCGVAKFFIDGVVETGTAWLVEPDARGQGLSPFWPEPERYKEGVALFAGAGFQCATHAVGDRAVQTALDAYEAAGASATARVRHRIEHIEVIQDADVPRFAGLGVAASMQPLHMEAARADESDEWAARLGPERTARAFRAQTLRSSGATVALGSDWMVAPFDPRIGMAWARLRRAPGQLEMPPRAVNQALTPLQALEGYTTSAAVTVSEEDVAGRIKPGYRADLTGFAADPVDADADALPELPIRMTVVDGRVVYEGR
jgi:predicted amidohydrolase YtcJ